MFYFLKGNLMYKRLSLQLYLIISFIPMFVLSEQDDLIVEEVTGDKALHWVKRIHPQTIVYIQVMPEDLLIN